MNGDPHVILVSSDAADVLKELLAKARQLADPLGWKVSVLPLSPDFPLNPSVMGEAGADVVYRLEGNSQPDGNPEISTMILAEAIRQIKPDLVLVGATKQGMEVAPRVAERMNTGYGAWVADLKIDTETGRPTAQCGLYTGLGLATYQFTTSTTVLTVASGVFKSQSIPGRTAQVSSLTLPYTEPRMKINAYHPKGVGSSRLEEAHAVVDIGQGVKQRDDLLLAETIASLLDAQLACTRPVSADRDWFPEWLGLSGKKISPELCLAIGISGAVQHIIGIRDSRVIVAVNNDENAGIFSQVDFGVVADLYAFLPALAERLKIRKVKPTWNN